MDFLFVFTKWFSYCLNRSENRISVLCVSRPKMYLVCFFLFCPSGLVLVLCRSCKLIKYYLYISVYISLWFALIFEFWESMCILCPIATYASVTWVLKENVINKLMIFERRIMRKIFGPTRIDDGYWRIKTNEEFD